MEQQTENKITEIKMDTITTDSGHLQLLALSSLLLLLLLLGAPHFVDVKQFNCDDVTFQRTVTVLGATDVDVGVQDLRRDVRVRPITFVDP